MQITQNAVSEDVSIELTVSISPLNASMDLDGVRILDQSLSPFLDLLDDYNSHSLSGRRPPEIKRLFTELPQNLNEASRLLIRSFAVSAMFFPLRILQDSRDETKASASIDESAEHVLYHFAMYEKTGEIGPQPTMYFVNRKKVENNRVGLDFLQGKGLVHRYSLKTTRLWKSYYMPFQIPRIRRAQLLPHLLLWQSIVKDRNDEIEDFVEGRR